MAVKSMFTLAGIMTVGSLLVGCGLDGVRDNRPRHLRKIVT